MRFLLTLLLASGALSAAEYSLKAEPQNIAWGYYSATAKPVLRIQSGDIVTIQTVSGAPARLEAAGLPANQIQPELRAVYEQVKDRGPGGHLLTGPVYVEGAAPGDTLEVRILEVKLDVPYAYNSFRPGSGFLPDDFTAAKTKIIPLDRERMIGHFADKIQLPLKPFFGSMGLAPPEVSGRINSAPPWVHAGNLDNKDLVAGTKLFIPVHAPGGLFEVGDGHAGQGDGEVDITAMETSLSGRFQFIVHKGTFLRWPRGETPTHFIVMGLHEDLTEATKLVVREAIEFLVSEKGMTREDAYMLSSVAVDFHITQLVDGTKGVHGLIPKAIFKQ